MSWEPLNLALIEDRPPVRPTLGALGLLYPGRRHVFSGMPESGKTIAAYIEIIAAARAGGRVVLIDLEMGPWDARDRLRDLGATNAELERVLYVEPTTSATPEIIAALIELGPVLVVIDASAGAYELSQLDDNKRQDVEVFARLYVNAFWAAGIASVVIDHVNKAAEQRGRYAIGSERKIGGADVHLGFAAATALHRGGTGFIKITTHKDRFGHLPRPTAGTLRLESDPDTHAITWTLEHETAGGADGGEWKPTTLMEKVSRYLEELREPAPRGAIVSAVGGQKAFVLKAIDHLIRDGHAGETPGPRGAKLTASLHPFRVPDPFSPVPENEAVRPVLPFPPPTRGNGSGNGSDELERLAQLGDKLGLT